MARNALAPIAVPATVGDYTAAQPSTGIARSTRAQLDGGTAADQAALFVADDPTIAAGSIAGPFSPTNPATWPTGARRYLGLVTGVSPSSPSDWGPAVIALRVAGTTSVNLLASGLSAQAQITASVPETVGTYGNSFPISAIDGPVRAGFQGDALTGESADVYVTDATVTAGTGVPAASQRVGSITGGPNGQGLLLPTACLAMNVVLVCTAGTAGRTVRFSGYEGDDAGSVSAPANANVTGGTGVTMTATTGTATMQAPAGAVAVTAESLITLTAAGGAIQIAAPGVSVASTIANPQITQNQPAAGNSGQSFLYRAQSGNGAGQTGGITRLEAAPPNNGAAQGQVTLVTPPTSFGAGAQGVVGVGDCTAEPTTNPGVGFVFYSKGGGITVRAESGPAFYCDGAKLGFFSKASAAAAQPQVATYAVSFGSAARTLPAYVPVTPTDLPSALAAITAAQAAITATMAALSQWFADAKGAGLTQ